MRRWALHPGCGAFGDRSMSPREPFWESAYRDPNAETFGAASEEVGRVAAVLPAGAVALDVGCGDGRNALCLAEHGVSVEAFDRSRAGIEKLRRRAEAAGLDVRAWVQEVETFVFSKPFDLVVAHGVLHLLDRAAWHAALGAMQEHTTPGGWNIVAVFTDRLPAPPDLAAQIRGPFREGELLDHYRGWTVESWEAYTLSDEHPGGIRHQHPINKIVARKPRT